MQFFFTKGKKKGWLNDCINKILKIKQGNLTYKKIVTVIFYYIIRKQLK